MSGRRLVNQLHRLETVARTRARAANGGLELLRADPLSLMVRIGFEPDPWQARLLRSDASRILLLASRQAGKSEVAAALALREALVVPGSLVLLLSPSERQSGELQTKVFGYDDALG